MKHLVTTLVVLAVLAGTTALVAYRSAGDGDLKAAVRTGDALAWLRHEFKLNEEQYARIAAMHQAYSSVCEEHCRDIRRAARARQQVQNDPQAGEAARREAEERYETLRRVCETAIAAHVRECATVMAPEQAERYLAMVLPKIPDFDHQAPPNVDVSRHQH